MKKGFLFLSMVLVCLFTSIHTAWGEDQASIYLASLKAQTDPASTGSGQVKLTWLDITGKPMWVDLAKQMNYMALGDPTFLSKDYVYDGFGATAQLEGGTMIAIEGTEVPVEIGGEGSQIYMTSMVYFHAEAEPANGSYLADWTFTDPKITRMTSSSVPPAPVDPMGKIVYKEVWDDDLQDWVEVIDEENSIPLRTPCFKVLPKLENSTLYPPTDGGLELASLCASVAAEPNNLYALFNKYLLSNPVATNASLEATPNATANLSVTVEIDGDAASLDAADFAEEFTFTNNGSSEWTYDLAAALASKVVVANQKTRITIPVTYTYKNTGFSLKSTTMTISMAGDSPSTLNVNLSANALNPERPEAFLLEGKDDASPASGTLAEILATDISSYTNPIIKLNKPVANALTFSGKDFTLDLNGNTTQAITISSGNVTIAYSSFGGSATALTVNGGKAILNGGTFSSLIIGANGSVEQNGATITGVATNAGSLTTTEGTINGGLTSSKTLVMNGGTFKGSTAVTISGGTAAINRGTIEGTSYGLKVTKGEATIKKLAAITGGTYSAQRTGGTLTVECGKFGAPLNGSINFTSGYFKTNTYGVSTQGKTEMLVSAGVEYNEGYRYFLGTAEAAIAYGAGVCRIGDVSYSKLEDAIAYANNNPSVENIVIFMTNNYTLPAGYYTLPANATIVIPMSDTQAKEVNMTAPRIVFNDQNTATPYVTIQPTEFRRLTFASGVNMDVFGSIEVTCSQYASNEAYTAQPCGAYGHLVLEEGCRLTLQSSSEVRAWGFVTGKGEMDARRGAKVREMFQLGDWKGAMTSVAITGLVNSTDNPTLCNIVKSQGGVDNCDYSDKKIFPVTQYFIQNIESPVKYHPGAVLSTSAAVSEGLLGMSVSMAATDIAVVGVDGTHQAIFLMDEEADAENTWVRKWYDSENDIQVYDINSAAHIGSMVLDMGDINLLQYGTVPIRLNSAKFDLPLTSNFKIHLLSGSMDFKQNTILLPGAEVEVDKESTVSVAKDDTDPEHTGALYVYDAEDWNKYAYCNEYDGSSMAKGTAYTKTVRYAPSWNGRPTKRNEQVCPPDATINVHGTFQTATGFVYTSDHGANIFSTNEDAGTFIFNQNAEDAGTRTVYQVKGVKTYESQIFNPARLKHGDGTYENTNTAVAEDAYCYKEDLWTILKVDEHDGCFMKDNHGHYYAKPADYVAVVATKVFDDEDEFVKFNGNDDHTFSDAAGTGRLFILMDNCQWWEVEQKDNLYHCIHPLNDTYYYWVEEEEVFGETIPGHWAEKRFTITWKNWNGDVVDNYDVPYGTMAEFLGATPTRPADIDYTYDFTGWNPELGPVTQDVTYTATYEKKDRKYTIIFQNEGGSEIERQFLKHNDVPVCENTPTKIGHTLIWSPAIQAVTGDATYIATWVENPPTEYEVTFFDYNGTDVLQQGDVHVGDMPEFTSETPSGKPATSEFTYVFDHWSPEPEVVSATSVKSYTAVYREVAQIYTVTFRNEDNSVIESNEYAYGETPVCSATPTKENTAQYSYSFKWNPQIETVRENATYTAVFTSTTNKYTVTLKSNLSGVCSFTGAGTYDYGTTISNVVVIYDDNKYEFNGWDDGDENVEHASFTLTRDTIITANFTPITLVDKIVGKDESWTVPTDTEVKDLILTSDGTYSGEILDVNNLTIRGEAIFRLEQSMASRTWYAVGVPWRVDVNTGIYAGDTHLQVAMDIEVMEFDATIYANGGTNKTIWKYVDENGGIMQPGKLYMIYLARPASSVDFHKQSGASLQTLNLKVATISGGDDITANWNAIANPALYHANLATGAANDDVQKYTGKDSYVTGTTSGMIVGEPIFVQVENPKTVPAEKVSGGNGGSGAPAYRRVPLAESSADNRFIVEIAHEGQMTDRTIVQTAEEKEDKYVIGKDMAKIGVSSQVAQMWIDRYDAKLCKNTAEITNNRAEYPLSIYAPATDEYVISATQERGNMTLYLTYNGEVIWNLDNGAYTLSLDRGTTTNYGLRASARVPQITEGCDELMVDGAEKAQKVLIDEQVYIIRNGVVYSTDGRKVK